MCAPHDDRTHEGGCQPQPPDTAGRHRIPHEAHSSLRGEGGEGIRAARTFSTGSVKSATPTPASSTAATSRRTAEGHESAMDASSLLRQGLSLPQSSPPPSSAPSAQPPALPRARSPTAAPARFASPPPLPGRIRPAAPLSASALRWLARAAAHGRCERRRIWRASRRVEHALRCVRPCVFDFFFFWFPLFPVGKTEGRWGERGGRRRRRLRFAVGSRTLGFALLSPTVPVPGERASTDRCGRGVIRSAQAASGGWVLPPMQTHG